MNRYLLLLTIILFSVINSIFASANAPTTLKGTITDAVTGEPLIGASIIIDGTSYGAATDLDGVYIMHNVAPGTYKLLIRYLGYKDIDKENVVITAGQTTILDIEMSAESILEEEVIVTAQAKGQMAAINQERASDVIVNVVSSDKIKEVPDVNAAESIGRLPGVSLKRSGGEGSQVVIRGMQPQFSIIEVDGVRMQGTGNDRGVGLSTVSSEMLDGIELSKSLTADKDADAIGGIVNLRTATAEEGFHAGALARGGYNGLGKDFGDYKVAASVSNRWIDNSFGALFNISNERVNRSSQRLNSDYSSATKVHPIYNELGEIDQLATTNANIEEQKSIRHRTNGNLALDYKNEFMKLKFNNIYSHMSMDNENRNNQFRFSDNDFRMIANTTDPVEVMRQHALNGIFNLSYTELTVNYAYTANTYDYSADVYEMEDDDPFQVDETGVKYSSIKESNRIFTQPRSIIDKYYAVGEYGFPILKNNRRDTTNRNDNTHVVNLDWKIPFTVSDNLTGTVKVGFKYSNKKRVSNKTRINSKIYDGAIGQARVDSVWYKLYPELYHANLPQRGIDGRHFIDENYDWGEVLNGQYELGWGPDLDKLKEYHDVYYNSTVSNQRLYELDAIESSKEDYEVAEKLTAAYIMATINIGKDLTILPGVRFEQMKTEYSSSYIKADPFNPEGIAGGYPVPVSVKDRMNQHLFPSLNLKYTATNWMDVRGAYYKSTSRPNYSLLSPGIVTDVNYEDMKAYNPYLKPSTAHNVDLGVSFFSSHLGLFSVNYFHKQMTDLLYRLPAYQPKWFDQLEVGDDIDAGQIPAELYESLEKPRSLYPEEWFATGSNAKMNNYPVNNPHKGIINGLELSWQTNFWYLPRALSGLVLDLNYTYITSSYEVPYIAFKDGVGPPPLHLPTQVPIYATSDEDMPDQPANIFNARLGWDYKGFSTRASFRYETLTQKEFDQTRNQKNKYRDDMFRIDLNFAQKLGNGFTLSLDIMNLTSEMDREYYSPYNAVINDNEQYENKLEHYGMTAQLGIKYKF